MQGFAERQRKEVGFSEPSDPHSENAFIGLFDWASP